MTKVWVYTIIGYKLWYIASIFTALSAEDELFGEKNVSAIQSSADQLTAESPASSQECEWSSEVIDTNTDGKETRDILGISLES